VHHSVNDLIEQIVKHPDVSAVYANGPKIEKLTDNYALQQLCRLRRARRTSKQAIQNGREDVDVSGTSDSPSRMPSEAYQAKLITLAADHQHMLNEELAAMVVSTANRF
jgi:hypothetical protein